jgi:2-amino-4-hydroxy-6-hydroxymethyldihydropteridine diphosphokinase
MMAGNNCFIGLGSNIGDGPAIVEKACSEVARVAGIEWLRRSSLYRSAAWGRTDQADFTNAVAEITTTLPPLELLQVLLRIESTLGRLRNTGHWGPRTIDLDLLCYADWQISTPELVVPHPRMHLRAFVLVPLLQLEPEFAIPGLGKARELLENLDRQEVQIFV